MVASKEINTQAKATLAIQADPNADLSDRALNDMSTFDDIVNMFPGGLVDASAVLGDGFAVLDKGGKDRLIGVPLILIEWTEADGDYGRFTIVRLAQLNDQMQIVGKFIVIDGSSTGIHRQLSDFTAQYGRNHGMVVRHGLRRSDYTYVDEADGNKEKPASTYYLDLSA